MSLPSDVHRLPCVSRLATLEVKTKHATLVGCIIRGGGDQNSFMKFDDFLRLMGDNLRRARWAAALTQEQVAARGISYRYYQELERGQRNPTLRTLSEIAEILGTTVAALVETAGRTEVQQRTPLADLDVTAPRRGRKPRTHRPK